MTKEEITKLIQDNELFHGTVRLGVVMDINHLEKFANLIAAAEREACARLCEKENEEWGWDAHVLDVADEIRVRGQQ